MNRLLVLLSGIFFVTSTAGCTYTANYANMRVHHVENRQLKFLNTSTATRNAVREGQVTWLLLKRVCLTDVGSWIGERDLTVGVTITHGAPGTQQIGKGVVNATNVRDNNCLQFANRQVIDPFTLKLESYRIALDIVELPAKNAKLLSSLASSVLATASAAPQTAPAAKVGTALFDTFIKPEVESNQSHVHYEQDFEAYELRNDAENPEIPWQKGTFVLLPREGALYDVDGNKKKFVISVDKIYLDQLGELRVGNPTSPSATDPFFIDAPYAVMEIASSWRGADSANNNISETLRRAARAVAETQVDNRTDADNAIVSLRDAMSRNSDAITEWTQSLLMGAIVTMDSATDALASNKSSQEKNIALRSANARYNAFMQKYGTSGTAKAKLTAQEMEAMNSIDVAINNVLSPLIAEAKLKEAEAAKELAEAKAALKYAVTPSSKGQDAAVAAAFDAVTNAAQQQQKWTTFSSPGL